MSIIWCLILISHLFSSVGLNSVGIELFVNMGYFINVFFAESRSPAWPCNVELPQPSSKEYDSDYRDDDDDDNNEMDELSVDQMIFLLF